MFETVLKNLPLFNSNKFKFVLDGKLDVKFTAIRRLQVQMPNHKQCLF